MNSWEFISGEDRFKELTILGEIKLDVPLSCEGTSYDRT